MRTCTDAAPFIFRIRYFAFAFQIFPLLPPSPPPLPRCTDCFFASWYFANVAGNSLNVRSPLVISKAPLSGFELSTKSFCMVEKMPFSVSISLSVGMGVNNDLAIVIESMVEYEHLTRKHSLFTSDISL